MSAFAGSHPKVTPQTPNILYQEAGGIGRDVSVDGHGTVVPGRLDEWSQNPAMNAVLVRFGAVLPFGGNSKAAFEYLRQHSEEPGQPSMLRVVWDVAGREGLRSTGDGETNSPFYPGAPPLSGPDNVYDRLKIYGLIYGATPQDRQKLFAEKYYENKLVPGVNEEQWMRDERGLRPLPERWVAPEGGIALFAELERRINVWGLAKATGADTEAATKASVRDAYNAFIAAWVPETFEGASPSFGDREYNPRSVFYSALFIEESITKNLPTSAAVSGPRCAMTLGSPQHFSRFESEGMRQTAAELQADEWRYFLKLPLVGGSGPGLGIGGQVSG